MSVGERILYIVRHGTTDWNQSGRIQGHIDIPLNGAGRAQARLAGQRLASLGTTAIYSSDLSRAYETASIIGQRVGLCVLPQAGLREINFGVWQGLSSPEIRARDPDTYAARRADPYDVAPEGADVAAILYPGGVYSRRDSGHDGGRASDRRDPQWGMHRTRFTCLGPGLHGKTQLRFP